MSEGRWDRALFDIGVWDGHPGVTTAGVKTFKLKMATKNASSSNFDGKINSVAWIKTA